LPVLAAKPPTIQQIRCGMRRIRISIWLFVILTHALAAVVVIWHEVNNCCFKCLSGFWPYLSIVPSLFRRVHVSTRAVGNTLHFTKIYKIFYTFTFYIKMKN